jgi:hypothetical protein
VLRLSLKQNLQRLAIRGRNLANPNALVDQCRHQLEVI